MTLMDSIDIGASGLLAHETRLNILTKNIANVDTPNYIRKIPVLMAKEDVSFEGLLNRVKENVFKTGVLPHVSGGVDCTGEVEDPTPGEMVYSPGHPDADKNGYVRRSNVNPLVDIADAHITSRAYEASLAVVSIAKSMAQRATDIGRAG